MLRKALFLSGFAMLMTVTPISRSASADKAVNEALIAGVALGVLGAAIAKNQHHNGHNSYTNHPHVSKEENEIGRCMHRAHRAMTNRGHTFVNYDHVVNYRPAASADRITLRITTNERGSNHPTEKNASCTFSGGEIVGFNIHNP